MTNLENYLTVILYILIPWSVINLTDYYVLRHGHYRTADFYAKNGAFGKVNVRTMIVYLIAFGIEVPFMNTLVFEGPAAKALGNGDIAWIVGAVVTVPLYLLAVRGTGSTARGARRDSLECRSLRASPRTRPRAAARSCGPWRSWTCWPPPSARSGWPEIAKEFGIPKSSCLALLRALAARDFIRQDETGAYALGLRSFEVGTAYLRAVTPVRGDPGVLRALTERLGMTAHFAVLEGDEVVYLAKQDPPGTGVRLASSLGARLSAWTTAVGKAQLAWADPPPGPARRPRPSSRPSGSAATRWTRASRRAGSSAWPRRCSAPVAAAAPSA